jgi:hypothetical protein
VCCATREKRRKKYIVAGLAKLCKKEKKAKKEREEKRKKVRKESVKLCTEKLRVLI